MIRSPTGLRRLFTSSLDITIVDTSTMLSGRPSADQCRRVVDGFLKHGVIAIRDPRVDERKNQEFLELMSSYFASRADTYYRGLPLDDARPETGFQVGVTPEKMERARGHADTIRTRFASNPPVTPQPPPHDGKWRFFWRVGEPAGADKLLLAPQVVPRDFPDWTAKMDTWGNVMLGACETVSEMLALGLDLPRDAFTERMKGAVQLLAPTGSDLSRYHQRDDVLAGFHYDLNFLTIHGKSNFPGLFVWLRNGEKVAVKIPDGCLLLQTGKMLEWLTGGHFYAGFHEVVVSEDTLRAVAKAKQSGKPLWRVSSTLFSGLNYDTVLRPLPRFRSLETASQYPPKKCYEYVEEELKAISLLKPSSN